MTKLRGFTLIELLVVIAIIAVLAALLFPVLGRTREIAKQSWCISNFRQAGVGMTLYRMDYDTLSVPTSHNPNPGANETNDRKWPQLVQPYQPEKRLLRCPSDSTPALLPGAAYDEDLANLMPSEYDYRLAERTNIGYNFMAIAPLGQTQNGQIQSVPLDESSFAQPSGLILAVDSVWQLTSTSRRPAGGGNYLVTAPCRYEQKGGALVDKVKLPGGYGFVNGSGSEWEREGTGRIVEFGGVYPWHNGRATVLFYDGRVKPLSIRELVAGCDVRPDLNGVVTQPDRYLWAPD